MSKSVNRIVSDPEICGGQPVFTGTRVMVFIVFECIKEGLSFTEILESYPSITLEDITAALDYVINYFKKTNRNTRRFL